MIPSRRLLLLLAAVTPGIVVGLLVPGTLGVVGLVDGLLLGAAALDSLRARRVGLEAHRVWPRLMQQGDREKLTLSLFATRPVEVRLRETLHPSLAAAPFRARLQVGDIDPETPHAWTTEVSVPLHATRRGEHPSGPLYARVLGPWGLSWSQRQVLGSEKVKIYPRYRWGGRVGQLLALARRRELGEVPLASQGLGAEMYALRRYREGDARNRINWRATAKRGYPVVREDTLERGTPLVLLFDCGRSMTAPGAEFGKLDYALAAGLALLRVASSRGDKVRVGAFSDRLERQLQVRPGEAGVRAAFEALYDLEARHAEPIYDLAADWVNQSAPPRATIVWFTSVVDLAAADLLRTAIQGLARRHPLMLINLEDPVLRALAEDPPSTAPEVFAKIHSLDILLHNRRLAKSLRRRGIVTVAASADQLALATLDSYLQLLKEGRAA